MIKELNFKLVVNKLEEEEAAK